MNLLPQIEKWLLPDIMLPAQYVGGEPGSVAKPPKSVKGRFCFAFPDAYTIGMSNYGLQLLYAIMNRRDDWACERVFTPYPDFEKLLRKKGLPLYSLENGSPLSEFDVVGFTLQYEMSFTNILTMLDLGDIPLHSSDRKRTDPLVIAGGPSAVNPEPLADFIDLFVIGDGEESLPLVCDAWLEYRDKYQNRRVALLEMARRFSFVYVPQFYHVEFDAATGRAKRPKPMEEGVPELIHTVTVSDLEKHDPPVHRIVPLIECVQDRVSIEIMRGCPGRCKFCNSTVQKRPIRCRSIENIVNLAYESCLATGGDEVSLLSLSTSDYPRFEELIRQLRDKLSTLGSMVSISVPSLRITHQLSSVMSLLTTERTSGLTIAPEAARDEMRKRIGKPITNENLLAGCQAAFENGFHRVKMYFLCGLPEETDDDIDGIFDLSMQIAQLGKRVRNRFPTVTVNVSNFVPKPHTPWERYGMKERQTLFAIHDRLKNKVRRTPLSLKYHTLETSLLEGLLSRGDRRLGAVIESVWRQGARLDAWSDYFRYDLWEQTITASGLPIDRIVHTDYAETDELPWGHIRLTEP